MKNETNVVYRNKKNEIVIASWQDNREMREKGFQFVMTESDYNFAKEQTQAIINAEPSEAISEQRIEEISAQVREQIKKKKEDALSRVFAALVDAIDEGEVEHD